MSFVEGVYRLDEGEWRIFVFTRDNVAEHVVRDNLRWDSGVFGINVRWPRTRKLDKPAVLRALSELTGVEDWREQNGPDSITLR